MARASPTVTRFRLRPFRNGDPPALADLWNRGTPDRSAARPLAVHEFDSAIMGKLHFDAAGLIVAERLEDGRPVGFAHAGFGPADPAGLDHRLDPTLGTVAMMVVEPGLADDPELGPALVAGAAAYLRSRGAAVIYAGGQAPLNPFYWGLYGGSEFAGILAEHAAFRRAVEAVGFRPAASTVLMELTLADWREARDPKLAFLRRQTRLEVIEDRLFPGWWDALALEPFRPTAFHLFSKADGSFLARATTWDMAWFGRDGRTRSGLIAFDVEPSRRRAGYGRLLVGEILRHARSQLIEVLAVQTGATNAPALALYESAGFARVGTSTLYRLPGASEPPAAPALALNESAGFARVGTSTLYRLPGASEPPDPVA